MGLSALGAGRAQGILDLIRDVPDYPSPGIMFRDITGMLANGPAYQDVVSALAAALPGEVDVVVGLEARGFLLAAPLATHLGLGFVPIRKAGKLPPPTSAVTYDLEYGTATMEIRDGTITPGSRVFVVDDVLATGGTAAAGAQLVEACGGVVAGFGFLLELGGLGGRDRLTDYSIATLLHVES